jgi:uncharacterized protein involved in exopolysaccharide biosynthesis/Mrp family chromosome partitioning ATPase
VDQPLQLPSPQEHEQEMTLRDILNVVFRHWNKIVVFFICTIVFVAIATLKMPKTYESTAQLMIRIGRENATLDPTVANGAGLNISDSRENEINSEMEVMHSEELATKVVQTIGINRILCRKQGKVAIDQLSPLDSLKLRNSALLAVSKNLTTAVAKKTNVINITFDNSNPQTAQDVINCLIKVYQEKHMAIYRPAESYDFFEKQTDTLNAQLKAEEDSLRSMQNSTGIASVETQRIDLLSRISTLQLELERVNADFAASSARIQDMQKNIDNLPSIIRDQKITSTGIGQNSSNELRVRLNELKLKKDELLTKYGDSSRMVMDIQQQITQTETLLENEEFNNNRSTATRDIQMALLTEKSNFSSLSARRNSVNSALQSARAELVRFNTNSVGISRLQRQQQLYEQNFKKYSDNLEQTRIDHELKAGNLSNIAIVQAATFPIKPIKPKKLINAILGLFLGVFGSLCFAFILEFFDHTIKSTDEVESFLRIPVLGIIPFFDKSKKTYQQSSSNQTYESIRFALQSINANGSSARSVGIVSCYRGEGVSTVAGNLSKVLAAHHSQSKVLLVDLNLDSSSTHASGRSPASAPSDMAILEPEFAFFVQPISPGIDTSFNVLAPLKKGQTRQIATVLTQSKQQYDFVIFDIPPLSQSSKIVSYSQFFDGVIMVFESEHVRRQVAKQVLTKLSRARIPVFGAVINKRKFYVPQWVYNRL